MLRMVVFVFSLMFFLFYVSAAKVAKKQFGRKYFRIYLKCVVTIENFQNPQIQLFSKNSNEKGG